MPPALQAASSPEVRRQADAEQGHPPSEADERFKEMKIGLFYDQAKDHRHVFVTDNDHEAFGVLLTGGAKWIAGQIFSDLLLIKTMLLDFYHLSQHVHEAAKCRLDEIQPLAEDEEW